MSIKIVASRMRKLILLAAVLLLAAGCADDAPGGAYAAGYDARTGEAEPGGATLIDLRDGAEAFIGFELEMLFVEGADFSLDFTGVSLSAALAANNIAEFSKVELVVSGMDNNMDITEWARADAGVFLAWSESGIPAEPFTVLPRDAATENLLIRGVTGVIVTG